MQLCHNITLQSTLTDLPMVCTAPCSYCMMIYLSAFDSITILSDGHLTILLLLSSCSPSICIPTHTQSLHTTVPTLPYIKTYISYPQIPARKVKTSILAFIWAVLLQHIRCESDIISSIRREPSREEMKNTKVMSRIAHLYETLEVRLAP
jgi:hypothetical protein